MPKIYPLSGIKIPIPLLSLALGVNEVLAWHGGFLTNFKR